MPHTFSCEKEDQGSDEFSSLSGKSIQELESQKCFPFDNEVNAISHNGYSEEPDEPLISNHIPQIEVHPKKTEEEVKSEENEAREKSMKKPNKHVYISEEIEEDVSIETTALRRDSDKSDSVLDHSNMSENYLTMSGTIKRGKKKGQSIDVILNMSREELEILEATMTTKKPNLKSLECTPNVGFHIMLWSLICLPFSIALTAVYSFCIGTITWYNIFTFYSEEKPICYRILVTPFLILIYPFLIVFLSLGLGFYAGFSQLSWHWGVWLKEISDFEKGFYGWLCNALNLSDCAPYEVVILSGVQKSASVM